jgi:hypothetical protein
MGKKVVLLTILAALAFAGVYALDFDIRPRGYVFIPLGDGNDGPGGNERYTIGGGGDVGLEIDLASVWPNPLGLGYTAGLEGGFLFNPLKSPAEGNVQMYSFGGGLGLYYFPLSRLLTRLDTAFGVYQSVDGEVKTEPGLWWRFGGELGFRFTPALTLAANAGWRQYQSVNGSGVFNSGFYTGLTVQIVLETRNSRDGISLDVVQDDGVYPLFLSLYQHTPAATLVIRNDESAEIRNVRVSFRAGSYTSSEFPCGTLSMIGKRRSVELPLFADFAPEILGFTENGRIVGEVVIRYTLLGKEREAARSAAVQVYNRNVFPAVDTAGLAAFVSSASTEILEFSKYITGMARTQRRVGLNQNLQFGMWLFESLRAYGINITGSKERGISSKEIQFPAQTLAYKSGAALDVALLYASLLESAGIRAAVIPLRDDVLIGLSLHAAEAQAATLFNGYDKILIVNDEVWVPLSMNILNSGFSAAWSAAAAELNEVFQAGEMADFNIIEDCWIVYPPAPFPALDARISQPDMAAVSGGAMAALNSYTTSEIEPLVREAQRAAQSSGSAAGYNRLGILLVRAGRIPEAKTAYERAAGLGSIPAMNNRGYLALNENDYAAAERWFRQALQIQPGNATALRGMEQATANR